MKKPIIVQALNSTTLAGNWQRCDAPVPTQQISILTPSVGLPEAADLGQLHITFYVLGKFRQ